MSCGFVGDVKKEENTISESDCHTLGAVVGFSGS